jgi:hypothetical protein
LATSWTPGPGPTSGDDVGTSNNASDSLDGGAGNDTLIGNGGNDTLVGGTGNDSLEGGRGRDLLQGGDDDDFLDGGNNPDTLEGGDGNDTLEGGSGSDDLSGDDGNDQIFGEGGRDNIDGGLGDDILDGGGGRDTITGGQGSDTLTGGAGRDQLTGGAGNDTFVFNSGDGNDTIFDFGDGTFGDGDASNNDFLDLSAFYTTADDLRADLADGVLNDVPSGSITFGGTSLDFSTATNAQIRDAFNVVCFARGTRIACREGHIPVEDLQVGDLVMTLDEGLQPVRWIGCNRVDSKDLSRNTRLRPIRIKANALGVGQPEQDLLVSRQHRIMVRSVIAERIFGTNEVLIPANKLLCIDGVEEETPAADIEYWHFLFDAHQLVWSNGALTESLYTGPEALRTVSQEARAEIETLFPEICRPGFRPLPARPIPKRGKDMQNLAFRHQKNRKPICDAQRPF